MKDSVSPLKSPDEGKQSGKFTVNRGSMQDRPTLVFDDDPEQPKRFSKFSANSCFSGTSGSAGSGQSRPSREQTPDTSDPASSRAGKTPQRRAVHDDGQVDIELVQRMTSTKTEMGRSLCQRRIARFIENKYVLFVSVTVTIYALIGDDMRLLCTNKPADIAFNVIVLFCLLFFTVEIILSSMGKQDYWMGFYFLLDVVATCSLLLDLTWVSELLVANDEDLSMGDRARSGRTARVGASVGRVVRVLRLVRIVKLYKAYFDKVGAMARKAPEPGSDEEAEFWDSEGDWVSTADSTGVRNQEVHTESLVGKKLVSLTTRRVIILVLVMLLALPVLRIDTSAVISTSAAWGADSIWDAFRLYDGGNGADSGAIKGNYEEKLLKFVHYHNWFTGNLGCPSDESCSSSFYSHVFWVGVASSNTVKLANVSQQATIRKTAVTDFDKELHDRNYLYDLGTMPSEVRDALSAPWTTSCKYGGLDHLGFSLLAHEVEGKVDYPVACPSDLRPQEKMRVSPTLLTRDQFDSWHFAFFFDTRPFIKEEAVMGVVTTAFICIVLLTATLLFSKDANDFVLRPVERMIDKVNTIRDDPLSAMKLADAELKIEERKKHNASRVTSSQHSWLETWRTRLRKATMCKYAPWAPQKQELMETAILEATIIKLGSLLALGFGQAGVRIVASNMKDVTTGVNAMIPGHRVDAIIGNARIRDFSSATEVLREKVMTFVNQIAEIVHGIVDEFHGSGNRNNGDTFLCVWRAEGLTEDRRTRLADMSVISFARILMALHQSPILARYRAHPSLQQRLGSNCRVNLSFGLHFGWAIEGAVGSEFKIDASYLSPNVNIAESLENATRIYDVSIIASETVVNLVSKDMAARCRLIDKVIIKGSKVPLELHVIDLDFSTLEVLERRQHIPWSVRQRFRARQTLEVEKRRKWMDDFALVELFDGSREMQSMRRRFTVDFSQLFNMGYQNYSQGEWQVARRLLTTTLNMLGVKDGPSSALLSFMEIPHQFEAPDWWKGIHELKGDTS